MKRLIRVLFTVGSVIGLIASGVFGMRFHNTKKYGWDEEEDFALHDYSNYPESFDGGTVKHFESGMANGFHLIPNEPITAEPIVVFGGSEGSSDFALAEQLATRGYEVYSLFFFGAHNQTETLKRVPLEFFNDFLDYANLIGENVTVVGSSKGAELGLVLTNYYDEVNNLVLYPPSSYVFMGLDFRGGVGSSWSWQGEELPYIDMTQLGFGTYIRLSFDMVVLNPVKYRETYESAVGVANNREEARIELSNLKGKALLFGGRDDAMWQGDIAAEQIDEALGGSAEVVIYDDAGHIFGGPPYMAGMALGGTEEANNEAASDSDKIMFKFLEDHVAK